MHEKLEKPTDRVIPVSQSDNGGLCGRGEQNVSENV